VSSIFQHDILRQVKICFSEKSSIRNFIKIYFDMVTLVTNISMW